MIQHVVMWKFRAGTEAQAEEFLTGLAALEGQIDCIRAMSVRRSAVENSAYDAALIAEFDTLEDVEKYKNDPRHLKVAAICKEIRTERCAIDVEK
ncbi:MAG: Dabb family protein [Oscillospiraceae bacterium]|nr:Dabb family protein [Oscillospiraceae bacterium]